MTKEQFPPPINKIDEELNKIDEEIKHLRMLAIDEEEKKAMDEQVRKDGGYPQSAYADTTLSEIEQKIIELKEKRKKLEELKLK